MSINWKHPFWTYLLYALIIVALFVGGWFLIGRLLPHNEPGPTANEIRSDSLKITKPIDQALIDSSNARIVTRGKVSTKAEDAARIAQDRANMAKHTADSLAIARAWEGAYIARTEERDSLQSVVRSDSTVISNLKADTTDLRGQLGIVNKRLKTTEDVNDGLRKDLANARKCKIIGLVNCPSRIQTVALTAATFFAVDRYQRR